MHPFRAGFLRSEDGVPLQLGFFYRCVLGDVHHLYHILDTTYFEMVHQNAEEAVQREDLQQHLQ